MTNPQAAKVAHENGIPSHFLSVFQQSSSSPARGDTPETLSFMLSGSCDIDKEKLLVLYAGETSGQKHVLLGTKVCKSLTWPRLFGQFFRFDKWNVCQG